MSVHLSIFLFTLPTRISLWFEPFFFPVSPSFFFPWSRERDRKKRNDSRQCKRHLWSVCSKENRNSFDPGTRWTLRNKRTPSTQLVAIECLVSTCSLLTLFFFFFFLEPQVASVTLPWISSAHMARKRTVFGSVVRDPFLLSRGHPLAPAGASNANDRTGNLSKQGSKVPNRKAQTPFKRIQAQTTQIYIRPGACPPDKVEQESEIRQIFISSDTHTRTFGLSRWSKLVYFWQAFLLHNINRGMMM